MKTAEITIISVLILSCSASFGCLMRPYITAESTAETISGGQYDGWYLYTIDIVWNLGWHGAGLSHWDLILKPDCAADDHIIVELDGHSTSDKYPDDPTALAWTGYFLTEGDGSTGITYPVIKFEDPFTPPDDEPGAQGYGTFSFISNIIPEYGTYEDKILAKGGRCACMVFGNLEGAYPSCNVPEPSTVAIMTAGLLVLRRRLIKQY